MQSECTRGHALVCCLTGLRAIVDRPTGIIAVWEINVHSTKGCRICLTSPYSTNFSQLPQTIFLLLHHQTCSLLPYVSHCRVRTGWAGLVDGAVYLGHTSFFIVTIILPPHQLSSNNIFRCLQCRLSMHVFWLIHILVYFLEFRYFFGKSILMSMDQRKVCSRRSLRDLWWHNTRWPTTG